jgi:cytoplasmic iron level regulating protein YaaA (DUF328/UPF0246 family)
VLILLPPSEGKTAAATGGPVDLAELWLPAIAPARRRVLSKLTTLCGRVSRRGELAALEALGLSAGQRDELARNAALAAAPAAAAAAVYTGVLYAALDLPTLSPAARAAVEGWAVVFSGLWGAIRLTDRIPAYRCGIGARLPRLGALAPYWRGVLRPALDAAAGDGPVLDLRSAAYAAAWAPSGELAARTAAVRVLHDGRVVSHFNKATKGRLVRALATDAAAPESVPELITALRDLKYTVEERPTSAGRPRELDIVVAEL